MHTIQLIQHRERAVAIVTRGHAIVSDRVPPADLPIVQAMCVYALEVQAGERDGPYRDADAELHALSSQRDAHEQAPRRLASRRRQERR